MKRLLQFGLLALLFCGVCRGQTITLVCSNSNSSTSSGSVQCTGTPSQAGDSLFVLTQHRNGDLLSAVTFSDNQSDAVWQVADGRNVSGSQPICAASPYDNCNFAWIIPSVGSAVSTTYTESWTTNEPYAEIAVFECNGCAADPWDGVAQNYGTTAGNSGGANGFGGNSNDVALGMCTTDGSVTAGSGFTQLGTLTSPNTVLEYKLNAASNASASCGNSGSTWTTAIVLAVKTVANAPPYVRQAVATIGSSNNIGTATGEMPITGTPGGSLFFLAGQSAGTETLNLTDSGSHTWTTIISHQLLTCFTSSFAACRSGYLPNSPTTIKWIEVNGTGGDNGSAAFLEVVGIATSSPLDVSNDQNGSSTSYTSPSVTTTSYGEFAIGTLLSTANSCCNISTVTPGGSWNLAVEDLNTANVTSLSYQIVGATTSLANTGTISLASGTSANTNTGIATFLIAPIAASLTLAETTTANWNPFRVTPSAANTFSCSQFYSVFLASTCSGNIYSLSLTLTESGGWSQTALLQAVAGGSLPETTGLTPTSLLNAVGATTLAESGGLTDSGALLVPFTATLGETGSLTGADALAAAAAETLAEASTLSDLTVLSAAASLTLPQSDAISDSSLLNAVGAATLGEAGSLTAVGGFVSNNPISLAETGGLTDATLLAAAGPLTLAEAGGLAESTALHAVSVATLGETSGLADSGTMHAAVGASLGETSSLIGFGGFLLNLGITLGEIGAVTDSSALAVAANTTLAETGAMSGGSQLQASGTAAFGAANFWTGSTLLKALASLALGAGSTMNGSNVVTLTSHWPNGNPGTISGSVPGSDTRGSATGSGTHGNVPAPSTGGDVR